MDASAFFADLVAGQKAGRARGIGSVCSAHEIVLEAAFAQAALDGLPVLIESTVNQVNQDGGYTGITPEGFRAFVRAAAERAGFPFDRMILGGDHLGPYAWRREPAAAAMEKARVLVAACVKAGYQKIHLDASMRLADDAADAHGAVSPKIVAEREADLAAAAEAAVAPGAPAPVYVIGTEVPVPGGEVSAAAGPAVTRAAELEETVALCRDAFRARDLAAAWERVVAVVAQPGVEFGDQAVHPYDRGRAAGLTAAARALPGLVLEGHSTDYQLPRLLGALVEDGVAILKVGPALTFALRECLFALEAIEEELAAAAADAARGPRFSEALEAAMLADPKHWSSYYRGTPAQLRFARRWSLSDRSRYYLGVPAVRAAMDALFASLGRREIPLPLLSQYLPRHEAAVREGRVRARPRDLARDAVRRVLAQYSAAARGATA